MPRILNLFSPQDWMSQKLQYGTGDPQFPQRAPGLQLSLVWEELGSNAILKHE